MGQEVKNEENEEPQMTPKGVIEVVIFLEWGILGKKQV